MLLHSKCSKNYVNILHDFAPSAIDSESVQTTLSLMPVSTFKFDDLDFLFII
jgi:hypothetical protein